MPNSASPVVYGHQYVDGTPEPLYEFGYGKTYSTFSYGNVTLSSGGGPGSQNITAKATDQLTAKVKVWNTSKRDGTEVVQLYVEDLIASVAVPNRSLKGFKKVMIKAGSSEEVEIPLKVADLGVWDIRMKYVVEPGDFRVWVGASSKDLKTKAMLTVV